MADSVPTQDWPFLEAENLSVFTTTRVLDGSHPIRLVVHDEDGDWQFLCGTVADREHVRVASLGYMFERDRSVGELHDLPTGWRAWRDSTDEEWEREPR